MKNVLWEEDPYLFELIEMGKSDFVGINVVVILLSSLIYSFDRMAQDGWFVSSLNERPKGRLQMLLELSRASRGQTEAKQIPWHKNVFPSSHIPLFFFLG